MTITNTLVLQGRECPLCGSDELKKNFGKAHDVSTETDMTVLECVHCKIAWQWPVKRSKIDSVRFFDSAYKTAEKGTYFDNDQKCAIAKIELEFVNSIVNRPGMLLDLGSGNGAFAKKAFEIGWSAYGIDPAGPEYHELDAHRSLHLYKGTLSQIDPGQKFDVITMWDVIEHLEDPVSILHHCKSILSEGGWLFIETGNWESTERIRNGRKWWCFQLDHRWYFSPKSMKKLLSGLGMGNFQLLETTPRPWVHQDGTYDGPSLSDYGSACVKRPWSIARYIREFRCLKELACNAPDTANLQIFAIAAQKQTS